MTIAGETSVPDLDIVTALDLVTAAAATQDPVMRSRDETEAEWPRRLVGPGRFPAAGSGRVLAAGHAAVVVSAGPPMPCRSGA